MLLSLSASGAVVAPIPYFTDYFLKAASFAWVFYLGALWLLATSR